MGPTIHSLTPTMPTMVKFIFNITKIVLPS